MTVSSDRRQLSAVVIGAGPMGLAAAAHLLIRGVEPLVLERGPHVGTAVREWAHVRMFSPWQLNLDQAASSLLEANGWQAPELDEIPTGSDMLNQYLEPLAALPDIRSRLLLEHRVCAVTRRGVDKSTDRGRERSPFELVVDTPERRRHLLASVVIDASGTWSQPNRAGGGEVPAEGEAELQDRIAYGVPDVLGRDRSRYVGQRVLVLGSGHSALNVLIDLVELNEQTAAPVEVIWAIRGSELPQPTGPPAELPARTAVEEGARALVRVGKIVLETGFAATRFTRVGDGVRVSDDQRELAVDRVVVSTGFRPDLNMLRELRLRLDERVETASSLAPLIDPGLYSCGGVPPHGVDELRHPEPDLFVVGMKSYGRMPTFLLRTGYEQLRSVSDVLTPHVPAVAPSVEMAQASPG